MVVVLNKWLVAWLCCLINFMHYGIIKLSSMFFVEAMERFDASRKQAAIPFTIQYAIVCASGPLVGYLTNIIGLHRVILMGCILSPTAVICCFFVEDIIMFSVLWAGVYSLGLSLGTMLLPMIIVHRFGNKASVGNGIALMGNSFGGFLLPNLTHELLQIYGISGTLLVLGGLMLNVIPLSMLLTIYKNGPTERKQKPEIKSKDLNSDSSNQQQSLPHYVQETDLGQNKSCFLIKQNLDNHSSQGNNQGSVLSAHFTEELYLASCNEKQVFDSETILNKSPPTETELRSIKQSTPTLRIFLDPTFIMIMVAHSTLVYIYVAILTTSVDIGRDIGVKLNQESYLFISFNVSEMVAKLCLGILPDSGLLTSIQFTVIGFLVMGGAFLMVLLNFGFGVFVTFLCIQGFCIGGLLCVFPGICIEYIEKENHAIVLASRFVLFAPLCLTQAPLIGYFREQQHSYHGFLILQSIACFVCAVLVCLIPSSAGRRKNAPN